MIKQFAQFITSFLLKEDIIKSSDLEIYQYGTEQILVNVMVLIVIGIFATIFNIWIATIFMILGFLPIRMVAGGYHANTLKRCNIITFSVYAVNMIIIQLIKNSITYEVFYIVFTLSIILIFIFAPVDHKNMVFNKQKKERMKRNSRIVIVILGIFSLTMIKIFNAISIISLSTMMGAFTASFSIFIGSIKRGREEHEKSKIST